MQHRETGMVQDTNQWETLSQSPRHLTELRKPHHGGGRHKGLQRRILKAGFEAMIFEDHPHLT